MDSSTMPDATIHEQQLRDCWPLPSARTTTRGTPSESTTHLRCRAAAMVQKASQRGTTPSAVR